MTRKRSLREKAECDCSEFYGRPCACERMDSVQDGFTATQVVL